MLFKYDFSKVEVKLLFSLMDKVYRSDGGINFTELFEFLKGLEKAEESISENISSETGISTKIGTSHDEKNESISNDSSINDVISPETDREQTLKLAPPDQSTNTRVTIDSSPEVHLILKEILLLSTKLRRIPILFEKERGSLGDQSLSK